MKMNLREAIIKRVSQKSDADLKDVIEQSVGGEEQALPGIGVLFEMIWQQCDDPLKDQLVTLLQQQLQMKGVAT